MPIVASQQIPLKFNVFYSILIKNIKFNHYTKHQKIKFKNYCMIKFNFNIIKLFVKTYFKVTFIQWCVFRYFGSRQ